VTSPRGAAALTLLASIALAFGCRSQPPDPTTGPQSQPPSATVPPSSAASSHPPTSPSHDSQEAGTADAGQRATAGSDAGSADATDAASANGAPTVDDVLGGTSFTKQVQAAARVAACVGDDAWIPANLDKRMVDKHCAALKPLYADYKREWMDVAMPFLAKLRPQGAPDKVVYPFGGGDLLHALATYPDAMEVTTISLEIAGDVRGIDKADPGRLSRELATLRSHLGKLFLKAHSRTENLDIETRGAVPGEVGFTMAALYLHGFEPVTLRYFTFESDGALHYLTDQEIEKNDKQGRAGPFANAEIRFHKPGDKRVRILRHVAYDLSDGSLKRSPALLAHLDAKKKVSAMTKAASHLLWDDANFFTIRDWLMTHTDWMISDTTGVPPRIAKKYGFVQDLFGLYEWPEPFGTVNNADAKAFKEAFKATSNGPISFRYGYPDNKSHGHIVVTRKPDVGSGRP
jgi:hypothetical protein